LFRRFRTIRGWRQFAVALRAWRRRVRAGEFAKTLLFRFAQLAIGILIEPAPERDHDGGAEDFDDFARAGAWPPGAITSPISSPISGALASAVSLGITRRKLAAAGIQFLARGLGFFGIEPAVLVDIEAAHDLRAGIETALAWPAIARATNRTA
jgi:hypothetical protein